jgi:hypothetical protein
MHVLKDDKQKEFERVREEALASQEWKDAEAATAAILEKWNTFAHGLREDLAKLPGFDPNTLSVTQADARAMEFQMWLGQVANDVQLRLLIRLMGEIGGKDGPSA